MIYKKDVLDNGLRVISVPMENANSFTVMVLVGTGSKYETKHINGISHFLEHMFFKGTKKRSNTLKISETLDMVGGEYNAFTSKEVTGFYAKVAKQHADTALDWIFDIFLNSKFDGEEMEREKGVIVEELNMYLDTPTAYVGELFEKLLYGDQPAGWRIIGEKENIWNFSREELIKYYQSHYSPQNTIVCMAGAFDAKETESKVKSYFEGIKNGPKSIKEKVQESQSGSNVLLFSKKTDQTHLCLGTRTYGVYDKRRYALALMSIILGGNMSSRLFIKVRERNGLAYSIHTSNEHTTDTGYLVTQAGINHKNLETVVEIILQEYKSLKEDRILPKELQKAKDYLKGITLLSLDSSDSIASYYATQEILERDILTPEEKFKLIDKVTAEDIKKIAGEIFVENKLNLSAIGPFEKNDEKTIKELLKL